MCRKVKKCTKRKKKRGGRKRGGFIGALLTVAGEAIASAVGGSLLDRAIQDISNAIEAAKRPPIDLNKSDLKYYIPPFFKTKSNPTGAMLEMPEMVEEEEEPGQRGTGLRRKRRKTKKRTLRRTNIV